MVNPFKQLSRGYIVQNSKHIIIHLLLCSCATLFSGLLQAQALPPLTHRLTAIDDGTAAPIMKLQNMDEEWLELGELKGKAVVVNFWATWCPPCRREMGSLERLYQATKIKGVEVLAVNIGEDIDTVFSFLGTVEPQPSFHMLFDADGGSMDAWGVRGLPTTFIVGPDGNIAYRAVGGREFDHPEIQQKIIALTRE